MKTGTQHLMNLKHSTVDSKRLFGKKYLFLHTLQSFLQR
jgi:hypothetical protein